MPAVLSNFVLQTLFPLFILLTPINGQLLTTEYLNIKLPFPNNCPTPYYDGDDSIYLFGGCSPTPPRDILKFSISSETLQKIGSLPGDATRGIVQSDNFGNIFYFGGGSGFRNVYKFDPISNITTTVTSLPYNIQNSVSIKYNSTADTVFILGGYDQGYNLLSFDLESLSTSTNFTSLPFPIYSGTSVRVGNKAYIFDDTYPSVNRMALELDLDTLDLQPVGPSTLPLFELHPSSIFDGSYVYLVGGYYPNTGPMDGLIQFDPVTKENNFIPVRNFPVEGLSYFNNAPASIFVPSRNRIYFFGGLSFNNTANSYINHDEIFYIDLSPLVEPTPSTTTSSSTSTTLTISRIDLMISTPIP